MKIIHTADWHLGNTFHGYSRLDEHHHFLQWLLGVLREQQPDALLVTGDVFDTANPSASAERLYYDFLLEAVRAVPGLQVVVTAGNHDSAGRLEATSQLLRPLGVYVRGLVPRREDDDAPDFDQLILPLSARTGPEAEVVCFALPFLRPADYAPGLSASEGLAWYLQQLQRRLRQSDFRGLPVVVAAHFYAAGASVCEGEHSERLVVGGQDCVEASAVECGAAYVALGHLHKAQRVPARQPMHYAGSALPMSFTEKGYRHGVTLVSIDAEGQAATERIVYTPQRALLSIPATGAALPHAVLEACAALPRRNDQPDEATWPYLELHVEERQPELSFAHDVTTILGERAVRLCRMVREVPAAEAGTTTEAEHVTLQQLQPIDVARRMFQSLYHVEMPEAMLERFGRAAELAAREP